MTTDRELAEVVVSYELVTALIAKLAARLQQNLDSSGTAVPSGAGSQCPTTVAYQKGWVACARWAKRDDLISDIGSPAFLAERDAALDGDCGATRVAREAEHGPGVIPQTGLREQCEAKADPGVGEEVARH